jgi:hypothetical protein
MSLEEKLLRNDVESYLRGEEPPADVLAVAPRLEKWAASISRGPQSYEMTLLGVATGHPYLVDGREATTSPIVWLDRKGRWARSQNRLWKLGEPEGTEIPIDGVDL